MGLGHDRSDGDWEVMPLQRLKVGFPSGSDDKESAYSAGDVRDMGSIPGSGKVPCGRQWLPTPVFLSGESHGQRSLAGYSPRGHKESDTTEAYFLMFKCYLYFLFCELSKNIHFSVSSWF